MKIRKTLCFFVIISAIFSYLPTRAADSNNLLFGKINITSENGNYVFKRNVTNNTSKDAELSFVVAIYDKNNQFIEAELIEGNTVAPYEDKEIEINIGSKKFSYFRIFTWNNSTQIKPLCETVRFDDYATEIAKYTTTRYAGGIVNWHMTSQEQYAQGIKGGEMGQMIYSVAFPDENPDKILVGSDCMMVYRSEDGGQNFVPSSDGLKVRGVIGIDFYPGSDDIVFAACSSGSSSGGTEKLEDEGIYKSTDGGKTWEHKKNINIYTAKSASCFAFGDELNENGYYPVYALAHGEGIYRSDDCGETWQCILSAPEEGMLYNMDKSGDTIAVTAGTAGLYISADQGATWDTYAVSTSSYPNNEVCGVAINPADSNNIIVCSSSVIFKTKDKGATWSIVKELGDINDINSGGVLVNLMFGAKREDGTARLYIGLSASSYFWRYSDNYNDEPFLGFINRVTINKPTLIGEPSENYTGVENTGWYARGLALSKSDPNRVVSCYNGISISTDGGTNFTGVNHSGLSGFRANSFVFNEDDPSDILIACIDYGINRSISADGEWYPLMQYSPNGSLRNAYGPNAADAARDPQNRNRILLLLGDWSGKRAMLESVDNGHSYSVIELSRFDNTDTLTAAEIKKKRVVSGNRIFFHKQNPDVIYAGDYVSRDAGLTWQKLGMTDNNQMTITAMSESDSDVVYCDIGKNIYKSEDAGKTFEFYASARHDIKNITVDYEQPYRLYVGEYAWSAHIIDNGKATMLSTSNGLETSVGGILAIYDFAQDPKNPDHLVAGGTDQVNYSPYKAIFESFDRGKTWTSVALPEPGDVWRVQFHPTRPQVYIATSGGTYVYEFERNH